MANAIEIALQFKDNVSGGLERAKGQIESLTGSIGGLALGAAGVAAALAAMAVRLADEVEQLDNLSASTGVSARNLQVLQFAFKQGGVDSGALAQGINFLNRAIASNDPALARLGVTSRDTFTAFQQAAKGLQQVSDASERAKLMFDVFGRGGAQLSPILNSLAVDFSGVESAAEATGNVLSGAQLKAVSNLDAATDRLAATSAGLWKQLAADAAPSVMLVVNALNEMLGALERLNDFAKNKGEDLGDFIAHKLGIKGKGGGGTWEDLTEPKNGGFGKVLGPGNAEGIKTLEAAMATQKAKADELKKAYDAVAKARADAMGGLSSTNLSPQNRIGQPSIGLAGLADTGIIEQAERAHEHARKLAEQMTRTFEDMGRNIQFTLMSVFMNITNKSQTFGSAMANIFRGVRDAVLQAIFEIVSAQITGALLKLLGIVLTSFGFPGAGAAVGVVGGKIAGGNVMTGAPVAPMAAMGGGGGNQFFIQTFNAKDTLSQLVSGTGSFRRANDRLAEVGAAS